MEKKDLLKILDACAANGDKEAAHGNADDALIDFINDADIRAAYENIEKWYA